MKDNKFSNDCFKTIQELKGIVAAFAKTSGLALAFIDFLGNKGLISHVLCMSSFCKMIRATSKGSELCKKCDYENSKEIEKEKSTRTYKCHAGLWEFSIPIVFRHELVAAICGGQLCPDDFAASRIDGLSESLGVDNQKLLNTFKDLKVTSQKNLEKTISSLDYLVQKIVLSTERQYIIEEAVQIKGLLESFDPNPKDVLNLIFERCSELVGGADRGCILRRDPNSGTIINMISCKKGQKCIGEELDGAIKNAIDNKKAILIRDASKSEIDANRACSKIIVPICLIKTTMLLVS